MSQPSGTPVLWRILILAVVAGVTLLVWFARESVGVRGQSVAGVVCFLGVAAACSANLRGVHWRTVATGLGLQLLLAVLILQVDVVYHAFEAIGRAISKFLDFANAGPGFVFGPLADYGSSEKAFGRDNGFIFAVRALPAVIFVSAVFTVLYHLRRLAGGRVGVRPGHAVRVRAAG